jgi:hypothetical protein
MRSNGLFAFILSGLVSNAPAYAQAQSSWAHIMKPRGATSAATTSPGNLIDHGGLVLPTTTIYAIWWGDPSGFPSDAQAGIDSLLQGFEESTYLAIANQYMRGATTTTTFGGNLFDPTSPPTNNVSLNNGTSAASSVANEICQLVHSHGIAPSPTSVYFLFANAYPKNANFCAFHDVATCYGTNVHFAFIPNTTDYEACNITDYGVLFAPNGYSQGTQAMASTTAHEFMETITDPEVTAWYDSAGNEAGDKCSYLFQSAVPLSNGSRWKLQEEWSNQTSSCNQGSGMNVQVLGAVSNSGTLATFSAPGVTFGTLGLSVNKNGAIAGWYYDSGDNSGSRAFLRDSTGTLTTFDAPGATNGTVATGINGAGAISGAYPALGSAFVRDASGAFTSFAAFSAAATYAVDQESINDAGAVASDYQDSKYLYHGYLRGPTGEITTFDAPGAMGTSSTGTRSFGINGSNAIVGYYSDANGVNHGYVRDPRGNISTIDVPGAGTNPGQGTIAESINGLGAIAGYYTDANNMNHGFVRNLYGSIIAFDAPGATYGTFAYSINSAGTVAGYFSDLSGLSHAFMRDATGKFSMPNVAGGSYGSVATSINDQGTITGYVTVGNP